MRLQSYLSHAGICSRRGAVEIIASGRVRVNGKIIAEAGIHVEEEDRVFLDGRRIFPEKKKVYLALHKPVRVLCSCKNPNDKKPIAADLVKSLVQERVYNVGRLDYMTSGLLFFTNDGDFAQKLTHPSFAVEKEYKVQGTRPISRKFLDDFKRGLMIEGERLQIRDYALKQDQKTVFLTLGEGRNREIRRVFESAGIIIRSICRVRIGSVTLRNMASGTVRFLSRKEVESFDRPGPKKSSSRSSFAGRPARGRETGTDSRRGGPEQRVSESPAEPGERFSRKPPRTRREDSGKKAGGFSRTKRTPLPARKERSFAGAEEENRNKRPPRSSKTPTRTPRPRTPRTNPAGTRPRDARS